MPVYEVVITVGFGNDGKIVWEDVFRYIVLAPTKEKAIELGIGALPEPYSEMVLDVSVRGLAGEGVVCKGWPP